MTYDWGQLGAVCSQLISSKCLQPGYADCSAVSTRNGVCEDFIGGMYLYIYIHYRVDGTMLNKCVVHSFMLFLIYFCTFMLQMGSIGNHLKLSMVPFVQERKYISIHNPPGSRMSNT